MKMTTALQQQRQLVWDWAERRSIYDPAIVWSALALICLGLVVLSSASIHIAKQNFDQPFYYLIRQGIFLCVGMLAAFAVLKIKIDTWRQYSPLLLVLSMLLLVCVLIPGIGREVNGSARWIGMGAFNIQPSELIKLVMVVYLAAYCVSQGDALRTSSKAFVQPVIVVGIVSFLLLLEPDFGSTVVVITTTMSILFLAGVRLRIFLAFLVVIILMLGLLALVSPYRLERLTSFLNPWEQAFNSGYQLTQALIAFGRGEWFGLGLGGSVQKLFYLPEAHTDFLFAVLAEELGLVGVIVVIGLFVLLVGRTMKIGFNAFEQKQWFHAYLAIGLGVLIGFQALINMGVNMGVLPTKGLTLPLMSYGGSSLIMNIVIVSLLMRLSYEQRVKIQ